MEGLADLTTKGIRSPANWGPIAGYPTSNGQSAGMRDNLPPSPGQAVSRIGMPRGYGYGASMGAWILDYLGNWVGEHGAVLHSDMKYRAPALTGDVTYLDATVSDLLDGRRVAAIDVVMTNQRGEVMAQGAAEVRLPDPAR